MPEKKPNHTDEYLIKKVQRLAKTWDKDALCEYFQIDSKTLDKLLKEPVKETPPAEDTGCENC